MPTQANLKPTGGPGIRPVELSVVVPCLNEAETLPEFLNDDEGGDVASDDGDPKPVTIAAE